MSETVLSMWTIYKDPTDYPGSFVTRRFSVTRDGPGLAHLVPDPLVHLATTLEEARSHVPEGRYCLGRGPLDEPQIVESWI